MIKLFLTGGTKAGPALQPSAQNTFVPEEKSNLQDNLSIKHFMICVKISEQLVIIVCPSGYTPDRGQIIVMVGPHRRLGGDSSQVEKKKWQINYE